jgi:SAM-dependent methyltransferase
MDENCDLEGIKRLYDESLKTHGATSPGVGWPDPEQHRIRNDKLVSLIDHAGEMDVNDLGCGYGDFFGFLRAKGISIRTYRGYDISSAMVEQARLKEPDGEFHIASRIDAGADYSFASGIFNVRLEQTEERWYEHIVRTLDNLAEFSRRGFAFNLLTSCVDFRRDHLFYGDPRAFFDLCKSRYSKQVALLHDYPLYEWTMLVRL